MEIGSDFQTDFSSRVGIRERLEPRTTEVIEKINIITEFIRQSVGKEPIVIIDDLDHVDPDLVWKIFYGYTKSLTRPDCKIMFTVPISLIYKREFARIERDFPIREVLPLIKTRNKDAERLGKESHKIFDDLEDMGGIACTLHLIGMINQERGRYDDAFGNYNASLEISEELGDKANVAYTLHEIGSIFFANGDYEKALEDYRKSLAIKEALRDRNGIASTLHQIGNIHQAKGEFEKALNEYNRSLKISEEIEDMLGIALTLGQVGRVKYEQMRYQESISALSRAESIFEELESPYRAQAITDLELVRTDIGDDMFNEMSKNQ